MAATQSTSASANINQPTPVAMKHTYTYPPELSKYAVPVTQVIEQSSPATCIAVGAYVFKATDAASTETSSPTATGNQTMPTISFPESDKELLLIRRSASEAAFPGMYEVPGGGAELPPIDATLLDSVARELYEETGLVAKKIVRLIDTAKFVGRKGDKWKKFNFEVEVAEGGEIVLEPSEHDGFKWVDKEDFLKQREVGEDGWLGKAMPSQMATIARAFAVNAGGFTDINEW